MSVIETPFGFLEVDDEGIGADASELGQAQFGETPKALDAVDVVFAPCELVFMMMDAVMFVAAQDKAVVGLPAIGIDGGLGEHLPPDDRHQFLPRAVLDNLGKDLSAPLEQPDDGRLAARPASAPAAHPARPEVALVHLDLARKRPRLLHGPLQNPTPQFVVKPLRGLHAQPAQTRAGQRRHVRAKQLQHRPELRLRNVRVMDISVFQ